MFKNFSLIIFFFTMIMGSLISISSNSWLGVWMGLEINLLSFIPLMINLDNSMSTEAALKYFLIQALASSILLFSVILMSFFKTMFISLYQYFNFNLILNSAILMKMGSAPFHFWFPEVMEGLSWMMSFILMTWQKIAPMLLIFYTMINFYISIIVMISIFIGSMGGINQTSLRKLMAYSSINHVGWLLSNFLISLSYWFIYFTFYTFLSFSIIILMNKLNVFYLSQIYSSMKTNFILKFSIFMNFLSLGGLPPFMGFFPKWMIIQNLMENLYLITFMVVFTLITLFYYIRITYSAFMINYTSFKWNLFNSSNLNEMNIFIIFSNFISMFGLMLVFFIYYIF